MRRHRPRPQPNRGPRRGKRTLPFRSVALRGSLLLVAGAALAAPKASPDSPSNSSPAQDLGAPSEPSVGDLKKLGLEDLVEVEIPTVYGASKHAQSITDAPSAVSLVTAEEIRRFGHRTLAEVLRSVRGLYTSYDRLYGYIGVRGFNRPGDFGGRTLVLINGHRLNEPLFDSAFNVTDFLLDVDLIDRVEVIRGPGSLLYGNNAFFGVINVVTRSGSQVDGTELSGSYGSFETTTGRLTYGNRFENGLDLLVSGSLYESKGRERLYLSEYDTPEFNHGLAEERDEDQFASGFASLRYGSFTLQGGFVRRDKNAALAPYGTAFNVAQPTLDTRAFASLSYAEELGDEWEVSARAYYDRYTLDVDYPSDVADPGDPRAIRWNIERDQAEWIGFETQVSKTLLQHHRVTLGAEARYDFHLSMTSYDIDPFELASDFSDQAGRVGAFLQDEITLLDTLSANVGLRYDYYATFGDTVNPRAGLIYHPAEKTTIKALYGQAYRAPNVWEYGFDNFYQRSNPNLGPETIQSYELVLEQYFGSETRLSVSGFFNDTQDLIGATPSTDPADSREYFSNLEQARALGAEFEAEYRTRSGWLARASYTLQRAEDVQSGAELSNSPQHLLKGNLVAPLWRDRVFAGIEAQYTSRARTLPGRNIGFADPFWVVNFTLYSRELVKGLEASASIYNLFDSRYSYPASSEFLPALIEQDGRSFRAKLTYKF